MNLQLGGLFYFFLSLSCSHSCQILVCRLDIRIAPVKKRALEQHSPSSSAVSLHSPSDQFPEEEKKGMKSSLRTHGACHDRSVRFSSDESVETFSGRSLRKRSTTVPHSYEELSDIDSDDDSGSARRKKVSYYKLKLFLIF